MSIEAMKMALKALESVYGESCDAIHALRTAIQQAESEPVGAREALERIASWSEHPAMLGVDYGSNGVRDYYRKIARDALTHPAPGVPDGYALVPIEPTPEMENAFRQAFTDQLHKRRNQWGREKHTMSAEGAGLRAMLAAAPKEGGAA